MLVLLFLMLLGQDCSQIGTVNDPYGGYFSVTHCQVGTPTPVGATPTPTRTTVAATPVASTPTPLPTGVAATPTGVVGTSGTVVTSSQNVSNVIAAAPAGSTFRLQAGTYNQAITINKPATVLADGDVTISGGCTRNNGIVIAASNVVVQGLTVTNTRQASIRINDGGNNTIHNNTLTVFDCDNNGDENEAGVAVWYADSGQRVTSNTIDRRPSQTQPTTGTNNGIWFKSSSESPSGGGHYIAYNSIRGVYDGIGGEVEDDSRGGFDRNTIIEYNTINWCRDDGISVEGGTTNIMVRNNTIRNCAIGIANAPNLTGPVYFENNDIREGRPGQYGNVQCFKIGNHGEGIAYYTGNYCELDGDGWAQTNAGVTSIIGRNNEIRVSRYVIEFNSPVSGADFDWDYDTMCTTDPERFVETPNGRFGSMAAWRNATGQEQNGVEC